MKLSEIMTPNPETVSPETTLCEVAEKMAQYNVGSIPVVENEKLMGTITDRDIVVRAIAKHLNPEEEQVINCMSTDIQSCFEDDDEKDAIDLMEEHQIRRVPIVDRYNKLLGIVSLGDIAKETRDQQMSGEALEQISEDRTAA